MRWCAEMIYAGSGLPLLPIVEWDSKPVGDGAVKLELAGARIQPREIRTYMGLRELEFPFF
ncbi:hypothetical protein E2562_028364 [Oryza meyeriana var. granulata]|uniref:Uncharacterized protein n=1 Tax=Oryza meyeriana var. granulata TaxID=110450 RepID=A0A6G1D7K8_9ORYZ|nr:hypothetical protein E2562_028364 [Oryza meyeriana var. granulata]